MRQTGYGLNDNVQQQVDRTHGSARISIRPKEVGAFGSYSLALQSGVMAAGLAAASPIFEFRWSSQSVIALITRVCISAVNDGTAFAATNTSCLFDLIRATGFTVCDATGSATVTLTGKSNARATRFAASQIQQAGTTNIVVSSTGALSAGTKTLDANALGEIAGTGGASGSAIVLLGRLWDPLEAGKGPIELGLNEGIVVRATVAATGTWRFTIDLDWDEVDPARYLAILG